MMNKTFFENEKMYLHFKKKTKTSSISNCNPILFLKTIVIVMVLSSVKAVDGISVPERDKDLNSFVSVPHHNTTESNKDNYINNEMNKLTLLEEKERRLLSSNILTVYAGTGSPGNTGNGGQATSANLYICQLIVADIFGNKYIGDAYYGSVRVVNSAGIISAFAGSSDVCEFFE